MQAIFQLTEQVVIVTLEHSLWVSVMLNMATNSNASQS